MNCFCFISVCQELISYWKLAQRKAYCTLPEKEQDRDTHYKHACVEGLGSILVKYVTYQVHLTPNFLKEN